MMFTLAPTVGSVQEMNAVSLGCQPRRLASRATHWPCVVPTSAQTAPNDGTFGILRYIWTLGMQPSFCRILRNAFVSVSICCACMTPASFFVTALRACVSGSDSEGYLRL